MNPAGDTLCSVWAQGKYENPPSLGLLTHARFARVWYEDPFAEWSVPPSLPARPSSHATGEAGPRTGRRGASAAAPSPGFRCPARVGVLF